MIKIVILLLLLVPDQSWAQNKETLLRFGHISVEDPAVQLKKYKPLLDILSKETGNEVILVQTSCYSKMNRAFLDREIDIGILNAFSYIQIAAQAGLIPLARRVIGNRGTYQSYIIVRREGNIFDYSDIKDKIFAFSDPNSTTGYLLPKIMLKNNGIYPETDLKEILFIGKHDSTIYAVLNWTASAGAVASYIYDSTDIKIKEKIRILDKSDPVPLGPMVIRKDLGKELENKIKKIILSLDKSEEGKTALQCAGLSRFEQAEDSDYDILRKMASF